VFNNQYSTIDFHFSSEFLSYSGDSRLKRWNFDDRGRPFAINCWPIMKFLSGLALFLMFLPAAAPVPVTTFDTPAAHGSEGPNLSVGGDGKVYLSWLEPMTPRGYSLRFSLRTPQGWSAPKTIARGTNWFVSSVDFPSITVLSDGTLAAYWLVATGGPASEAYDIQMVFSKDGGNTWGKPIYPHRDRKKRQHGFLSLVPTADRRLAAIWLDGRNMPDEYSGNMALMYTTISSAGALGAEMQIDNRTCECCQTSLAATPDGLIAVYRDRSAKEIRDISISRFANGKWSPPEDLSKDGWEIDGCPVNGPAASSNGKNVAVAWFTAPGEKPQVNVLTSTDGGKTFGKKLRVDGGNPAGRVSVLSLPSGDAVVSWIERFGPTPSLQVRRISANGVASAPVNVSQKLGVLSGGLPKLVLAGQDILITWTDASDEARIRTAVVSF